jgi:hypothetical protein
MSVESMEKLKNSMLEIKEKEEIQVKEIYKKNDGPYFVMAYNNFLENNDFKKPLDLLLFIILNKYVNDKKIYCNPSLKTLAKECKTSRSSIIRSLERLEILKYIVVKNEFYHEGKTTSIIWVAQFNKITGNIDKNSLKVYQCLSRKNDNY